MITVATWNVLHRIHAENWDEAVAGHWPDEAARIAAVTARVAERSEQVIALQEVSGDQLASLRRALPCRTVHTLRYPRVPKPRRVASALEDPAEYLVLLLDGMAEELTAESFVDDPGKGALAVRTGGVVVLATHVSGDRRRGGQLARLAELAPAGPPTVLLGDFNSDRTTVAAGLGAGFAVADLPEGALPTRPRTDGGKSKTIDHVVVRGAAKAIAAVDGVDGLSDHNLVHATITV